MRLSSTTAPLAVAFLSLALAAMPVAAGGPDMDHVSADATWIIHVDVTAALESKVGKMILEAQIEGRDEMLAHAREMGIDPTKDLLSITLYGTDFDEGPEVIVAETTAAVENLVGALQEQAPDYRQATIEGYECHMFGPACASIRGEGAKRLVVFAEQQANLIKGLRVIDGQLPSMSRSETGAMSVEVRPGAFVVAHVTGLSEIAKQGDPDEPVSIVASKAKSAAIQIGERDDLTFFNLRIVTNAEAEAQDIAGFGQGLLALGRMMTEDNAEMKALEPVLRAFRIEQDGNVVGVEVKFDPSGLPIADMLRDLH